MNRKIVIGSRGSQLALWQTNWVKRRIEEAFPGIEIEISVISTKGDRIQNVSLPKLGEQGKGLFTKEIEDAILDRRVDLAVHSLKDLPTDFDDGLHLGAICEREDSRDALVAPPSIKSFGDLPEGAVVGTSSLRRIAQILAVRPDLQTVPVRGNVDTRLRKLEEGQYSAIILAAAGLRRLGHGDRITEYLSSDLMLSAVGQGALGIETRADDEEINGIVGALGHEPTRIACTAERAFLKGLGGGCLVPIAALGVVEGGEIRLDGLVARPDGTEIVRGASSAPVSEPEVAGLSLAEELLERGADRILQR
ncbi:MAG TPA: hydroxymethylbilane synthase [Blastocatellia bacterium]|nr:hydroxymethylbilane synthase [Blastocatellia bacterium]